jgi:hypothetical protein
MDGKRRRLVRFLGLVERTTGRLVPDMTLPPDAAPGDSHVSSATEACVRGDRIVVQAGPNRIQVYEHE